MKARICIRIAAMIAASILILSAASLAQTAAPKPKGAKPVAKLDPNAVKPIPLPAPTVPPGRGKTETELTTPEEAEILPYYTNYLKEYRLGPSDIISVEVFGQCPDYCKTGITIPPNARVSYPLVRDGVLVAGKTVEQVAAEITKKLDEYIIDPKVTVTLDKAMSTRYSVMGNVAAPGVRVMDRKVSVYEAIIDAGGVTKTGNRKKVVIYSYNAQGRIVPRTVSLAAMEQGKGEMVFLSPGDQVFVPGKGFSIEKVFDILSKASVVRFLFGSPF